MAQCFPHEKLDIYGHVLRFAKMTVALIDSWPPAMAVRSQFGLAAESTVTNLAMEARVRAAEKGIVGGCDQC